MKSNSLFPLLAVLATGLAAAPQATYAQAKPLTQGELLRQIETLAPAGKDPGRGATSPNRATKAAVGAAAAASSALFPKKEEPKAEKVEKKAKGPTEIVALEATFDQKAHIAVFIGEVVVTDPEFTVRADKLTAHLKHDDKSANGPAGKAPTPAPAAGADKGKGGGLETAVAEADPGKVVTVTQEKVEADGAVTHSVGHGKKVHYDSNTGDITLYGMPDMQQGVNTCVASEEGTIMTLNRDGKMRVTGAHKTVIADQGNTNK